MTTGMHMPWCMCGSQRTALGTSSLCSLLEAISSLLFVVKARSTDTQLLGILMSSSPISSQERWIITDVCYNDQFYVGSRDSYPGPYTLPTVSPDFCGTLNLPPPCNVTAFHLYLWFCLFGDRVSLNTDWARTHYVVEVGLEVSVLLPLLPSTYQVLGFL